MLDRGSEAIADEFKRLSTERQMGMGIGPIPISKVREWLDREEVWDRPLRRHLENIMMALDALVCTRLRSEVEAKKPKEPPKPTNRPPSQKKRR